MPSEELRAWLGLNKAGAFAWAALICVGAMFLVADGTVDKSLATVAVLLAIVTTVLGVRSNPKVSPGTNVAVRIGWALTVPAVLFLVFIHYVAHFQLPQNGMYPGLPAGQHFLVLRHPYSSADEVNRGDIVVFKHTFDGRKTNLIWRVVGIPGDRIEVTRDKVAINGETLKRERIREDGSLVVYQESNGATTYEVAYEAKRPEKQLPDAAIWIPHDRFFVMGDNRDHALDSRSLGLIYFSAIIGRRW